MNIDAIYDVVATHGVQLVSDATVVAAVVLIGYVLWSRFLHPLAAVPGPWQARYGLGWMTVRALKEDFGWKLAAENEHFQNCLITDELNARRYKHTGGWDKTRFYQFFSAVPGSLVSTKNHHEHRMKRVGQSPAFAMNYLVKLESFVDKCLDDLMMLLKRQVEKSGNGVATIEMAETLQLLALDVVGELAFGESFHLCETGRDVQGWLPIFHGYTAGACLSGTQPWIGGIMSRVAKLRWRTPGAAALALRARECVQQRVKQMQTTKEKGEEEEERQDILAKLFSAKNPDGSTFTLGQVTGAAGSILGAGSDTTAITFRAVLRYIIEDARIYGKVMEEIQTAVDEGKLQFPITYGSGVNLEYFQACLKETLRLHAAVPWTLPRVVPSGGATVAGRYLPGGIEVSMSPYVVHRRPEAYGPDAHVFKPERWLEADAETKKTMERNLITFGSGSRVCIGKNISLMEITKVVPTLLYHFEFNFTPRSAHSPHQLPGRSVDGDLDDREPWNVASQWFATQRDFYVDVKERNPELAF
ncbi:hypothetical protein OIV83_000241 [Microbotryomycetes sp. JL201]|nr:hypothetical protein OIV83_000241 [Microbotryomycetes sp. JL201]